MTNRILKPIFVSINYPFDFLLGKQDNYIYPLSSDIIIKSKKYYGSLSYVDVNNKFYTTFSDENDKYKYKQVQPTCNWYRCELIDSLKNPDYRKLVNMIIDNKDSFYNYKLQSFYRALMFETNDFKNIQFDILEERKLIRSLETINEIVTYYNPKIDELEKYLPKKYIPTLDNYMELIEKYGTSIYDNSEDNYYYNLHILSCINPKFAEKIKSLMKKNLKWYEATYKKITYNKNWRCVINTGYEIDHNIEEVLKYNPCLIFCVKDESYHTEENYINALRNDCRSSYNLIPEKFRTANVNKYKH